MAQPHRSPDGDGQQSSLARAATAPTYASDRSSANSDPKKVFISSGSPSAPPGLRSDTSSSDPTSQNQLQRPSSAPPDLNPTPATGDPPGLCRINTYDPLQDGPLPSDDPNYRLPQRAYSPPAYFGMPPTIPFAPNIYGGQMYYPNYFPPPAYLGGYPMMPPMPFDPYHTQAPGSVPPTAPAGRTRIDAHAERAHARKSKTHDQSVPDPSADLVPGDDEGPFNGPWETWYIWRVQANEIRKKGTGPMSDTFRLVTDRGEYPFKMRMDRDEIGRRSENSFKFALICDGVTEGTKNLTVIWRLAVDTLDNPEEIEEHKFSRGRHYDFAGNSGKTCRLQQDMTLPTMTNKKEFYVHLQRQQRPLDNQEGGNKDIQEEATKLEDDPKLLAEMLADLRGKTLGELKKKAIGIGIGIDPVEDVDAEEDPKEACIKLILKEQAKPVDVGAPKSSPKTSLVAVADDIIKRMKIDSAETRGLLKIDSAVTRGLHLDVLVGEVAKMIMGAKKSMKEIKMELKKIAEDKGIKGQEITDVLMEEDSVIVQRFVRLIFQHESPSGLLSRVPT